MSVVLAGATVAAGLGVGCRSLSSPLLSGLAVDAAFAAFEPFAGFVEPATGLFGRSVARIRRYRSAGWHR